MTRRRAGLLVEGDHEQSLLLAVLLADGWADARSGRAPPDDPPAWTNPTWIRRGEDEVLVRTVQGHRNFGERSTQALAQQFLDGRVSGGLGFVLDADVYGSVASATASIRSAVSSYLPALPDAGEIGQHRGRPVGVWISPDNQRDDGCLDDLLVTALEHGLPDVVSAASAFVETVGVRRTPRAGGVAVGARSARRKLLAHVSLAPFNPGASLATVLRSDGERALAAARAPFARILAFVEGLLG